jgi:hypothetical protein
VQEKIVVVHQPHEYAGPHAGQGVPGQATMLHGLPGGLQQQAVLRVHLDRLALGDPEELGIEVGDVIKESAPFADRSTRHAWLGVVELLDVPAMGGNFGDEVVATQQRFPQQLRGVDASWQPACHTNYGNRSDSRPVHVFHPLHTDP